MGTEPEAVCGEKPAMTRRRGKTGVGKRAPEPSVPPRLRPISAKIGSALSREIDAYAADRGVMLDILGPPTLGILRLLAHWVSHGGGVKVNEDEVLAEIRAVGADEWEQAIAEAARLLSDPPQQPAGLTDVRD